MGQKVNPLSYRLGITINWKSRWYGKKKNYKEYLKEDFAIRKFVKDKLAKAAVADVVIERSLNVISVIILAGRPGVIIGRAGSGIEEFKKQLKSLLKTKSELKIEIQEAKHSEANATIVGQMIAEQIEKRTPFRRVIKQAIEKVMQNKEVKGVKVMVSGRLDGNEIARREWLAKGKIPLQTLRSNIDFARVNAYTTFGVIGIKVWIYKGEVFDEREKTRIEKRKVQ